MDDLVQWLHDQLGTDERLAALLSLDSSVPDQWEAKRTRQYNCGEFTIWSGERKVAAEALEASAFHIARHDPARVLREIEAKRRMVTEVAAAAASALDMEYGCCHEAAEILAGECPEISPSGLPLLRLLATVYEDRPGFREEWRIS